MCFFKHLVYCTFFFFFFLVVIYLCIRKEGETSLEN